jgi:hypothetical protein
MDREKVAILAEMVADAKAEHKRILGKAIAYADEHGLEFEWDDTYGSTYQTYHGKGSEYFTDRREDWESSYGDDSGRDTYGGEGRWTSSSDYC